MGNGTGKIFAKKPNVNAQTPIKPAQQNVVVGSQNIKIHNDSKAIYCPPPPDTYFKSRAPGNFDMNQYVAKHNFHLPEVRTKKSAVDYEKIVEESHDNVSAVTDLAIRNSNCYSNNSTGPNVPISLIINSEGKRKSASADTMTKNLAENWTLEDIYRWLAENGLEPLKEKFLDFDGKKLVALRDMYTRAPAIYFKEIKRHLDRPGLNVVLDFTNALAQLQHDNTSPGD